MSMFGARFAVFVRRARVLPSPCPATRNLSFLRFHRRRHTVVSSWCFTEMVRAGVKIPQDGNCTNMHGHVCVMHGHVWHVCVMITFFYQLVYTTCVYRDLKYVHCTEFRLYV